MFGKFRSFYSLHNTLATLMLLDRAPTTVAPTTAAPLNTTTAPLGPWLDMLNSVTMLSLADWPAFISSAEWVKM